MDLINKYFGDDKTIYDLYENEKIKKKKLKKLKKIEKLEEKYKNLLEDLNTNSKKLLKESFNIDKDDTIINDLYSERTEILCKIDITNFKIVQNK